IEGTDIEVGTKIAGRVERINVEEGDKIKEGDIIALISSEEIRASVDAAEAKCLYWENKKNQAEVALNLTKKLVEERINKARSDLASAKAMLEREKANMELAKKDFERYRELFKKKFVPKNIFDKYEIEYTSALKDVEVAEMELKEAKENLKIAKIERLNIPIKEKEVENAKKMLALSRAEYRRVKATLNDTIIRAPCSGIVLDKIVELGEVVTQGTPIVRIVDPKTLYLKVFIPNLDVGKVSYGDEAKIYPDALPNKSYDAVVTYISDEAEFTPKNVETKEQRVELVFEVKLSIKDVDELLKVGMPAEACIKYDENLDWSSYSR
ncbi:MAG: HlyD family efflux transporter periplasmic adaptor subunit, partial [Nitrospirae bacterium]